jgi:hypothetical protein
MKKFVERARKMGGEEAVQRLRYAIEEVRHAALHSMHNIHLQAGIRYGKWGQQPTHSDVQIDRYDKSRANRPAHYFSPDGMQTLLMHILTLYVFNCSILLF